MGEIKIIAFNFAPKSWAFCNGQFLPINQNQPLFALFGTMYGGNGQTTFALPDLRGRTPIHVGDGFTQGQLGGQAAHTLTQSEMPAHNHIVQASSTDGNSQAPNNTVLAREVGNIYRPDLPNAATLSGPSVTNIGGSQAHENTMPSLTLNFIVALVGVFPSRN